MTTCFACGTEYEQEADAEACFQRDMARHDEIEELEYQLGPFDENA